MTEFVVDPPPHSVRILKKPENMALVHASTGEKLVDALYDRVDCAIKTESAPLEIGAIGWVLGQERSGEASFRFAWPCRIFAEDADPVAPVRYYSRLGDGVEGSLTDSDAFIVWGSASEPLLRVVGAVSAAFSSEERVKMFMRALHEGHTRTGAAGPPPHPFEIVWSRQTVLPWPALVLPHEAALLLCAKQTIQACAKKHEAALLYLGTPCSPEYDFPPAAALSEWSFGRSKQADKKTAKEAQRVLGAATPGSVYGDATISPSFDAALRAATWLHRGMEEAWGDAASPEGDGAAASDAAAAATSPATAMGRGSGGDDAVDASPAVGVTRSSASEPDDVLHSAARAAPQSSITKRQTGAASAGSKRRREASSAVAALPAEAEPSRLTDIERELAEVEARRSALIRARDEMAAKVCRGAWGVTALLCVSQAGLRCPSQERQAAATAAVERVEATRAAIEERRAAAVNAEAAARQARERADSSYTLAVERATAKRDAALAKASHVLASTLEETSADLVGLSAELELHVGALIGFSDVLPPPPAAAGTAAGGPAAAPGSPAGHASDSTGAAAMPLLSGALPAPLEGASNFGALAAAPADDGSQAAAAAAAADEARPGPESPTEFGMSP